MANIQHLATPIRAQLAQPVSAVELAGLLHPTPAVGGEPHRRRRAADPGARGPRPRLVRRARSGWTDARRGRRVLRRAALRAAARPGRALLRRRRRRARLRPGGRAGRDRGQAPGAAAGARAAEPPSALDAPATRAVDAACATAPAGSARGVLVLGRADRRRAARSRRTRATTTRSASQSPSSDSVRAAARRGSGRRGRATVAPDPAAYAGVRVGVAHVDLADDVGGHCPERYAARGASTVDDLARPSRVR